MKVLYITGACLTRNTSANMSHNAFVQGLLENGCDVDIVMSSDSWGEEDQALPIWDQARYYCFSSTSLPDRIRKKLHRKTQARALAADGVKDSPLDPQSQSGNWRKWLRACWKRVFNAFFPRDPLYPLDSTWLKRASSFRNSAKYDLVISNSSPAASHRLALELIGKHHIACERWIQIWEDPWYHDLYGGHSELVEQEEHRLLQAASEIVYVSPLTLMYQKRYYPDCAEKMKCVPLPALRLEPGETCRAVDGKPSFGYFGDYYSQTRDLKPFYDALVASGFRGAIVGDSDISLPSTDEILVSRRVTLDKLQPIQDRTGILVHLSNLRGGQIPGKVYHYSVTDKPILFILDGTEEEKHALKDYFGQFDRYVFCENSEEQILDCLQAIAQGKQNCKTVTAFFPNEIVKKLLSRKDQSK